MRGVLIQIDARDPVTLAVVPLRMASVDDSLVCHLNHQTWWPVATKLPTLAYDLFSGAFDGKVETPTSTIAFYLAPWPDAAALRFADASVRLWTGEAGAPFAAWTQRFDGRCTVQPAIAGGVATATIAVDDTWLDQPVLDTYAGTGAEEGGPDLTNAAKPLALGSPRYAAGVLVDSVNTVVQLSSAGPIVAVDAAMDRLSRFPAAVADYPSHAALVAAVIPAGRFATCLAEGKVRHGAPPVGQLSYLVRGDKGADGSFPHTPGAMIARIAGLVGGGGRVDVTSLAALDLDRPMPLSIMVTAQTTARDLIQRIAQSVNCVAGVSWLGKLFVARVGAHGGVAATLRTDGSALPPVTKVEQVEAGTPWWRIDIEAQPTWTVHALADIAFEATLTPRGRYVATTVYREGDIVTLANQSTWLFIALTPASGHAPPDPAIQDAWWRQLQPAIVADGIIYEDGTSVEDLKPAAPGADKTADTPTGQAVDNGLNPDGTVKDGKVTTPAIAPSAVQQTAFALLGADAQLSGGATDNIFSFGFVKQEPTSIFKVSVFLDASSTDDLQFTANTTVADDGGSIVGSRQTRVNLTFTSAGSNAASPITPFAHFSGLPAGNYALNIAVTNTEASGNALTIHAGSAVEIAELKQGLI